MTGLPDFINYLPAFDPQLPPPYRFEDVSARIFFLKADQARLEALCDRRVNAALAAANQKVVVKPITSLVMMEVLQYEKMFATTLETANAGYSSQREFFLAIPVARYSDSAALANGIPQSVGVFVPFIFVDNDWSQITGREVFGYPKLDGQFDLPEDVTHTFPMTVAARILDPYQSTTHAEFKPIIKTRDSNDGIAPQSASKDDWPFGRLSLYDKREEDAPFPVSDPVLRLIESAAGGDLRNYLLRQFRDAKAPEKASYRSFLQSLMRLENFKSASFVSNPIIRFPGASDNPYQGYASMGLVDALGLELANESGDVVPILSMLFQGDFSFLHEETLVTQCGDNIFSQPPHPGCMDIMGAGCKETARLVKNHAHFMKNLLTKMAKAETDPDRYAEDFGHCCRNVASYCKSMARLTKDGMRHILPD